MYLFFIYSTSCPYLCKFILADRLIGEATEQKERIFFLIFGIIISFQTPRSETRPNTTPVTTLSGAGVGGATTLLF